MYKRDFTNFHESAFIEECQSVKWEEIVPPSSCRDPNYLFDSLYTKLSLSYHFVHWMWGLLGLDRDWNFVNMHRLHRWMACTS